MASFSNLPCLKSALHHYFNKKTNQVVSTRWWFQHIFYFHPLPKWGIFPHFDLYFLGDGLVDTTNVTSEAWVASEVRMPVVKMEMEPQKVALEEEESIDSPDVFCGGIFWVVHFFGYKDCKEHLERCFLRPDCLMVKFFPPKIDVDL